MQKGEDIDLPDLRGLIPRDPPAQTAAMWERALDRARGLGDLDEPLGFRGDHAPLHSAAQALERLRDELAQCVMAFQAVPSVRRLPDDAGYPGWHAWHVDVPLTLFPSRDRGFTVVDIAVQFETARPSTLQITRLSPAIATRSQAEIQLSAALSLGVSRAAGLPMPLTVDQATVADVAGALGWQLKPRALASEVSRMCRAAYILEGVRAAWRLDRPEAPLAVGLDAALLAIDLVAAPDAGPVTAYGAAIGSTRGIWLSASLGALYAHLKDLLGGLFIKRQPVECRATWPDLLPRGMP